MNEIVLFKAMWMDLETIILIEVSQKRKTITMGYTDVCNGKYDTNELILQKRNSLADLTKPPYDHQTRKEVGTGKPGI